MLCLLSLKNQKDSLSFINRMPLDTIPSIGAKVLKQDMKTALSKINLIEYNKSYQFLHIKGITPHNRTIINYCTRGVCNSLL